MEDNELGSFETAWIELVLFARGRPAQSFPFGVRCFLRFAQDDQPQRQRRQACLSPAGVAGVDDDLVRLVVDRQSLRYPNRSNRSPSGTFGRRQGLPAQPDDEIGTPTALPKELA